MLFIGIVTNTLWYRCQGCGELVKIKPQNEIKEVEDGKQEAE
jgi:hypothetical protein